MSVTRRLEPRSKALAELAQRLDVKPQTARSHLELLDRCYLTSELPSWTVGVSVRIGRQPKLHVTDAGLAAVVLGLDAARLGQQRWGGSFLESFVVNELTKQAAMIDQPLTFSHFRDRVEAEVSARCVGRNLTRVKPASNEPSRIAGHGLGVPRTVRSGYAVLDDTPQGWTGSGRTPAPVS